MKFFFNILFLIVFIVFLAYSDEGNADKPSSFVFDGTDDLIVVPNDQSINKPSMTISLEFKVLKGLSLKSGYNKTSQFLIFKQNPNLHFNEGIAVFFDEVAKNVTAIVSNTNRKQVYAYSPRGTIDYNKWYKLVVSADSISLRLFLDGKEQKSNPTGFPLVFGKEPLMIGGRSNVLLEKEKYGGMFSGEIKNISIYNQSIAEIGVEKFLSNNFQIDSILILNFKYHEQSGIVFDSFGKNNGVILRGRPSKSEINDFDYIKVSPNPTKGKTNISFNISQKTDLKLIIRDLSGKEVMSLYQGILDKGKHNFQLEAESLQSGFYVCYLETGSTINTASFIIAK